MIEGRMAKEFTRGLFSMILATYNLAHTIDDALDSTKGSNVPPH